jgi:PadR family transcriptional regulator, regulatory protein PadR
MKSERLRGHLDALLLSVLKAGPAHGYEVVSELRSRSGGEFDLPEGTVYPALHRLERQQLLVSEWDLHAGRRRRMYRLTADGEAALVTSAQEWRRFSASVDAVLGVVS